MFLKVSANLLIYFLKDYPLLDTYYWLPYTKLMATVITPKEGEKVLFTIRKNFITLIKPFFKLTTLLFIGVLSFLLIKNEIANLISLIVVFFALSYGFYYFLLWFYDVYIITNKRVICVNQKSLFSKEFSEMDYSTVKDVTYSIKGVFATIFRFGTVIVKGSENNMELVGLSYPDEVQEMIKGLSEKTKKSGLENMSAKELIDLIAGSHHK